MYSCLLAAVIAICSPGYLLTMNSEQLFREDGFVATASDLGRFFPTSADGINALAHRAMLSAKDAIDAIVAVPAGERTFANTALALDEACRRFSIAAAQCHTIGMTSTDKVLRDTARACVVTMSAFAVDVFSSRDVYRAIKSYADTMHEQLTDEQRYFVSKVVDDLEREGLQLPDEQFNQVQEIKKELAQLSVEFEENIAVAASAQLSFPVAALQGVAADALAAFKRDSNGNCLVGLDYPTVTEIMGHCTVRETRKALHKKFQNRAFPENDLVLKKIATARAKLAKLLGYPSFAAYDVANQMVVTPAHVESFFGELLPKISVAARTQHAELCKNLPEGVTLNSQGKFFPWDRGFVLRQYEQKHFNFDEREVANYFPVDHTLDRVFAIYQDFLGLNFELVPNVACWDKEVKLIRIIRRSDEKLLGYLYLDLFPRPFKYSHACFMDIVPPVDRVDCSYPSVGVVIANFPKSTATKPALLKHDDVVTFFHEFGHAMHGLLGRTTLAEFAGTNVLRDFVETPSQMFEEWMWNREVLKEVAQHFQTGSPMPDELLDRLISLRTFDAAFFVQRQAALSLYSLRIFGATPINDFAGFFRALSDEIITSSAVDPEVNFHAAFGHLSGYAAKYYCYMWTKLFALDLFDQLELRGDLLKAGEGALKVRKLLGAGGSIKPAILLRDFLGREPSQEAFLRRQGLHW